jgi:hypothetical protein
MDLQSRLDRYETKAAQCDEWARQAPEGPQRTFHEVLADYYREVAMDYRQVLAKREMA